MKTITDVIYNKGRIKVQVTGLEAAAKLADPITTRLQIIQAMEVGTDVALEALKAATPTRTGKTAKGWRKHAASGSRIEIQNNQPAAAILFYGARAHVITPQGKALSNVNNVRAQMYGEFGPVKKVMHPGFNAPDKYVQAIDYGAGQAAGEVAGNMIQGFYANHGSLQRRNIKGTFGTRF